MFMLKYVQRKKGQDKTPRIRGPRWLVLGRKGGKKATQDFAQTHLSTFSLELDDTHKPRH